MNKALYFVLVNLLRAAALVARVGWGKCARGILADAEGDSRYWEARRATVVNFTKLS